MQRVTSSWLYTATNTTFTNRTRHEGQLRLGTNLHILENTAAGVTAMVALDDMQTYVGQVRSSLVE